MGPKLLSRGPRLALNTSWTRIPSGGFLLTEESDGDIAVDLIAVDHDVRVRRIARRMIRERVAASRSESTRVRVGTQLDNLSSIRAYVGFGLELTRVRCVLRRSEEFR